MNLDTTAHSLREAVLRAGVGRLYGLVQAPDESDANFKKRVAYAPTQPPWGFTRAHLDNILQVNCNLTTYCVMDYDGRSELMILVLSEHVAAVTRILRDTVPCSVLILVETLYPDIETALQNMRGTPRLNLKGELI